MPANACTPCQPPARLTANPCAFNHSTIRSQWSPCTSITPSLTVPPLPHKVLSCLPRAIKLSPDKTTPYTIVTFFPPRPLLSRETRTTPSVFPGMRAALQLQVATGWRHTGHMRPLSVEYTRPLIPAGNFMMESACLQIDKYAVELLSAADCTP